MDDNQLSPIWKCFVCSTFIALTLKTLMGHYYAVHSNEPNFLVKCGVKGCPATFQRYHSFYKHVSRNHRREYDTNAFPQPGNLEEPIVVHVNPVTMNGEDESDYSENSESECSAGASGSDSTDSSCELSDYSETNEVPAEAKVFFIYSY